MTVSDYAKSALLGNGVDEAIAENALDFIKNHDSTKAMDIGWNKDMDMFPQVDADAMKTNVKRLAAKYLKTNHPNNPAIGVLAGNGGPGSPK